MSDTSIRSAADDGLPTVPVANLALYELQKPFIQPLLRLCRFSNTALDTLFYDVGALTTALLCQGHRNRHRRSEQFWHRARHPLQMLYLTAATNPSGSIIVVDAQLAPYVRKPFLEMG